MHSSGGDQDVGRRGGSHMLAFGLARSRVRLERAALILSSRKRDYIHLGDLFLHLV